MRAGLRYSPARPLRIEIIRHFEGFVEAEWRAEAGSHGALLKNVWNSTTKYSKYF